MKEGFLAVFGSGAMDKSAKGMAMAISGMLKTATKGPALNQFKADISKALDLDPKLHLNWAHSHQGYKALMRCYTSAVFYLSKKGICLAWGQY
jgi:hypothetical protein